jgi:hypothetical protein
MKLRTLLMTAVALVLAFSLSGQLMAEGHLSALYVGPAHSKPATSGTAGFGVGTIGMYTPISGTPCFDCFSLPTGAMAIGPAVAVATQGTGYTWFFTVQTNATTSGNIRILMRFVQDGVLIGTPLEGTLDFNADSVYIVYSTDPVITPSNPGVAGLVVGLQQSGVVAQSVLAPITIQ